MVISYNKIFQHVAWCNLLNGMWLPTIIWLFVYYFFKVCNSKSEQFTTDYQENKSH